MGNAAAAAAIAATNVRRALDKDEKTTENKEEFCYDEPLDDWKPMSKFEKIKDKVVWLFLWTLVSSCIIALLQLGYNITPIAQHKNAKRQGVKQILDSAHSDAVNSAYTMDLANYETTSKLKAKCDSLYYARKVSHFIYLHGNKFVKPRPITKEVYGVRYVIGYDSEIDLNRICKDQKFNKYVAGYKKSVQQLAMLRRTSNQK
ncbi:MAG: hypothetical protein J6T57_02745 [Alphaproteobacteria bacterium]|nr:hypothetical protein [Alphaproteobacteria bacterium]